MFTPGVTISEDGLGFTGTSHVELGSWLLPASSPAETLQLSFSSGAGAGLLLWRGQGAGQGAGEGAGKDFLLLHIRDGRPVLQYELGGGRGK